MAQPISNLSVGAKVKSPDTKYNGVPIIWLIGHKTANRAKLITEKIITLKCFDAKEASNPDSDRTIYGNNRYSQSNIDQWLNSAAAAGAWYSARHSYDAPPNNANVWSNYNEYDAEAGFLSNFEEAFRNAILDTTIRVAKNTVTDGGGYEDIIRKVYLLSETEVGLANENGVAEGTKWDLFSNDDSRKAKPTAEAVSASEYTNSSLNASSPWYWWLRTPTVGSSHSARHVNSDGSLGSSGAYSGSRGVRPALELPLTVMVSDDPDIDGAYIMQWRTWRTMTPYSGDTSVIGKLGTTPQERGLTTQQFKAKFDEGLKNFVEWFNDVHKTEFDAKADIDEIPEIPDTIMTIDKDQTMTAKLKAHNNTDYTTAQVRNIILSPDEADAKLMGNGDIWIQYEEGEE